MADCGCDKKSATNRAANLQQRAAQQTQQQAQAAASGQVGGISTRDYIAELTKLKNGG